MTLQEVIENATTAYACVERLYQDEGVTETIIIAGDNPEIILETLEDALSALRTIYQLYVKIQALDDKDAS